ncbi:MAG: carbohydrate kinase [Verrucomicrobia bacterium]|nr:carbohydrate kinase [Verrucomicrobiota bacterium]
MTPARFNEITSRYASLRLAVVGDFCLDRYLEIDPAMQETSIETGLPVHNVVNVRSQPGGAGTVTNNLVSLGVLTIHTIGFRGEDGEGFELENALSGLRGVRPGGFVRTPLRRTFTYCKPLVVSPGRPPVELNRLDSKNWSPTPAVVTGEVMRALNVVLPSLDALVVLDQVNVADTGVVTTALLGALQTALERYPVKTVIGDSRRSLRGWPDVMLKMNAAELAALTGMAATSNMADFCAVARKLAHTHGRNVFVTLSERGIIGATPAGEVAHVAAPPARGPIDVVGAGDAVTANLAAALAAGATLRESLELAMAAASIVVHQLGTTGTAGVEQIRALLVAEARS